MISGVIKIAQKRQLNKEWAIEEEYGISDESENNSIVKVENAERELLKFENTLIKYLERLSLPSSNIFVPVSERATVFFNVDGVLSRLSDTQLQNSVYITKYLAAVASGLFDAALNYLWDETILELRKRVSKYDLSYFYDQAIRSADRRKQFKDESDLVNLSNSELIEGARKIELISRIGFKHLEYINYMRNWASAAHPNQNQITGLESITWLETCIREVISLPMSNVAIEIKKLLANIKENPLTPDDAKSIGSFFLQLTQEQAGSLLSGFFGIYCDQSTKPQTRDNIHLLLPMLWPIAPEEIKNTLGMKYANYKVNNDIPEAKLARKFLELVGGLTYIPDQLKSAEIETAIDNLLQAHRGVDNFYTEPPFARALKILIGDTGSVPRQLRNYYVFSLVEVFLTNGNGVAVNAQPIYRELIKRFDSTQAILAILSFTQEKIASKLRVDLCEKKFRQLLQILKVKITSDIVNDLISDIENFQNPLDMLRDDPNLKEKVKALFKIIK